MRPRKTNKGGIIDLTDYCSGSINRPKPKRRNLLPAFLLLIALWAIILSAVYQLTQ